MTDEKPPLVSLTDVAKTFGQVRALAGVDFTVHPGRVIAVMGHNGAGKSTLMQIIAGTLPRDGGTFAVQGKSVSWAYHVPEAHGLGIRCVFQELSLCPNLTVTENTKLMHRGLRGAGWRARARDLILAKLDEIYPGHRIDPDRPVGTLPIAERQMVETARAFTETDTPVRLVILDEPTSALDARAAAQLLSYARKARDAGIAILFISHRLDEIFAHTDDLVIMRDGKIVGGGATSAFTPATLVEMMGMVEAERDAARVADISADAPIRVSAGGGLQARAGMIIGLAGLAGHGQRQLLQDIFDKAQGRGPADISVNGTLAYVAGDRQREGLFALWSVGRNITVGLRSLARRGFIDLAREVVVADTWRERFAIRVPDTGMAVTGLSGGNQQKVIVARAFAREADIVLLDDPLRGVDVGTKRELYSQIRDAASGGRTFLWYTTETAELENCDVVYVFYQNRISAVIPRGELSEQRVIEASFGEMAHVA